MERKVGGPRFHRDTIMPEVPDQMKVVKFHGQPVIVPQAEEGEPLLGNSGLTRRQLLVLVEYDLERRGVK